MDADARYISITFDIDRIDHRYHQSFMSIVHLISIPKPKVAMIPPLFFCRLPHHHLRAHELNRATDLIYVLSSRGDGRATPKAF
jgi:hypothetical protein